MYIRIKWHIYLKMNLTLSAMGWGDDRCILTGRALKLILYDFSSNFILNMRPVDFFSSVK